MKFHGVNVLTDNGFQFLQPYIYDSGWKPGTWYIYNGTNWVMVGGSCVQLIPFFDSNGSPFIVNGEQMYVRALIGERLKDSQGKYLNDTNNVQLFGDYRGT